MKYKKRVINRVSSDACLPEHMTHMNDLLSSKLF